MEMVIGKQDEAPRNVRNFRNEDIKKPAKCTYCPVADEGFFRGVNESEDVSYVTEALALLKERSSIRKRDLSQFCSCMRR